MDDSSREETLLTFVSVTGSDPTTGTQYLEATGWSLDAAMGLFFESGGASANNPSSSVAESSSSDAAVALADAFGVPVPRAPGAFINNGSMTQVPRPMMPPGGSEEDVRAPIDTVRQRLLRADTAPSSTHAAEMKREEQKRQQQKDDAQWMFPPPREIMFDGNFQAARMAGKEAKRWLLVNIQSVDQFASHQLNRDTWTDDAVLSMLGMHFILWQRSNASEEGIQFVSRYHVALSDLPCIAVVDPRTGAQRLILTGFTTPDVLCERMFDFVDGNSLDDVFAAPKPRAAVAASDRETGREEGSAGDEDVVVHDHGGGGEEAQTAAEGEEEEEDEDAALARAIFESMRDCGPGLNTNASVPQHLLGNHPPASDRRNEEPPAAQTQTESAEQEDTVPEEPPAAAEGSTRLQFRWCDGTSQIRRFMLTDRVASVYAFARPEDGRPFTLLGGFPPKSLEDRREQTLDEAGLAGAAIKMRWL